MRTEELQTGKRVCKRDRAGMLESREASLEPREQSFKERVLGSPSVVERSRRRGAEQHPSDWKRGWLLMILMRGVSEAHFSVW